ncbi:hypothetical protein F7725_016669 [Dissostichus mawsoni]|uniref:Uncharacterized protein n=1 Tax=Dissostichus mawsoni TaxID=36200 RepID=A0A7J5Z2Y3_DISMA|nr:hypothetical protein F7725_016669 [Dissostichus mawsoni]
MPGRATPDSASSTELFPELWSPMTAIAGRAKSFSTPRERRESMRSMQGRTFSSYCWFRLQILLILDHQQHLPLQSNGRLLQHLVADHQWDLVSQTLASNLKKEKERSPLSFSIHFLGHLQSFCGCYVHIAGDNHQADVREDILATPDSASSTELFPELWSPMTAIAGRAKSFSTPRERRESMRSMQGRTFSSYCWLREFMMVTSCSLRMSCLSPTSAASPVQLEGRLLHHMVADHQRDLLKSEFLRQFRNSGMAFIVESPTAKVKPFLTTTQVMPGRATPDSASSTELFPELWSPMTAIAGRAKSFSTQRAKRVDEVDAGTHLLLILLESS